MLTIRLDRNLEEKIENISVSLGITKSEIIRKSLLEYLDNLQKLNAWELGKSYFEKYSSKSGNLSTDRKSIFKQKISQKNKINE
ncbi:MAG: ribbon-helix-helix protein, CopG family [bacterium]